MRHDKIRKNQKKKNYFQENFVYKLNWENWELKWPLLSRHPELMYTIAAPLVVVYIGTLEVGMPELNEDKNGWILTWLNG